MALTSRVVVVVDDDRRLVEVEEGCFGPAVAVDGALVVVVFLSEVAMGEEGLRRLVGAEAETPLADAEIGRILAAVLGLVALAAGCDAGPKQTSWMEGKMRRERESKGQGRK